SSFVPCPRGSGRWERVLYPGAGGLRLHAWLVPRHGGAVLLPPWRGPRLLAQLSQERIRREIRHFAQSMQCNMFALKLGPLDKNDNRIRAVGDEISKIVTNSDDVHLEFHWMFRHL